jgi:hypothetical protein
MRLRLLTFLVLLASVAPVAAAPLSVPISDSYTWANGDSKSFELSWDGAQTFFTVQDLGTAIYDSLGGCCTDTFDRVRELYPGGSLTFTNLALNTLPVNTVFVDNLDLSLFRQGALDNLGVLTGTVTLEWDDPFARMAVLSFVARPEGGLTALAEAQEEVVATVPEPATLLLVGGTLLGGSWLERRRRRRNPTTHA